MARSRRSSVVALVSGGLDSCVLVQRLLARGATVCPLYVRGGLRWEAVELASLQRWLAQLRHPRLKSLGLLDLPVRALYTGSHWSVGRRRAPSASSSDAAVYLPGRNVLLLGEAAIYADRLGISRLALGTLMGNPFGDATPEFFRSFSHALRLALGRRIVIEAPLRRMTKAQVIAAHPHAPYQMTFSCLAPVRGTHCGRCNKCAERRRAFRRAGMVDNTIYITQ